MCSLSQPCLWSTNEVPLPSPCSMLSLVPRTSTSWSQSPCRTAYNSSHASPTAGPEPTPAASPGKMCCPHLAALVPPPPSSLARPPGSLELSPRLQRKARKLELAWTQGRRKLCTPSHSKEAQASLNEVKSVGGLQHRLQGFWGGGSCRHSGPYTNAWPEVEVRGGRRAVPGGAWCRSPRKTGPVAGAARLGSRTVEEAPVLWAALVFWGAAKWSEGISGPPHWLGTNWRGASGGRAGTRGAPRPQPPILPPVHLAGTSGAAGARENT